MLVNLPLHILPGKPLLIWAIKLNCLTVTTTGNTSRDLGFSKEDRLENIRRLGFVGLTLAKHGVISILAAINPYEEARYALKIATLLQKRYL